MTRSQIENDRALPLGTARTRRAVCFFALSAAAILIPYYSIARAQTTGATSNAAGVLAGNTENGKRIFEAQACSTCHGSQGQGGLPNPEKEDGAPRIGPTRLSPPAFAGQSLYDTRAISDITEASPKFVLGAGADWSWNNLTVNVLEKLYGPSAEWAQDGGHTLLANGQPKYFKSTIGTIPITNLDVGYHLNKWVKVDIGALNLFDRFPPRRNAQMLASFFSHANSTGAQVQPIWSPFGIDGGYYYAKATISF